MRTKYIILKIILNPNRHNYNSIGNVNPLNVYAEQWSANIEALRKAGTYDSLFKTIYAITNTGDTIGQMNLSCTQPTKKKIVFVYVDIGSGYDSSTLTKVNMINNLNKNSHNQMYREWEIDTNFSDTLDITSEYTANPQLFIYDSAALFKISKYMRRYYFNHKGVKITGVNSINMTNGSPSSNSWIRFAFLFPKEMIKNALPGDTIKTHHGDFSYGGTDGIFYKTASKNTVIHELGHGLKLDHTFDNPFNVLEGSSRNFMDYLPIDGTEKRHQFWYSQWMLIY